MELNLPESVVYEKRGPIAIITMNRPEAMNSLTKEMLIGLEPGRRLRLPAFTPA